MKVVRRRTETSVLAVSCCRRVRIDARAERGHQYRLRLGAPDRGRPVHGLPQYQAFISAAEQGYDAEAEAQSNLMRNYDDTAAQQLDLADIAGC
jgi:hypothetical protein